MNFLKQTYFSAPIASETQTEPMPEYTVLLDKLYSSYIGVYSIDTLQAENESLRNEVEALKKEITELKDTIQTQKTRDYVAKYHLLRQGKAFPFSPILSKSTPANHTEAPT